MMVSVGGLHGLFWKKTTHLGDITPFHHYFMKLA
jgi:hypothetical protein